MMAGLAQFIKLILRRDRIKLPLWLFGVIGFFAAMVPLLRNIYSSEESYQTLYNTFGANPAGLVLTGPMEAPSFGAFMTIETLLWGGLAVVLMNTLFMVRHTRHNEEIGAQELLLSGRAHRSSSLLAALVVAFGANLVLSIGTGLSISALGADWGNGSPWLFAVGMGAFGFCWAVISAVVVQFTESGRTANGTLAGLMGAAFLVRGVGDFLGSADPSGRHFAAWPSMLSPFGWLQSLRPLTFPDWQPLVVFGLFCVTTIILAFVLLMKRDVGAGLLPARIGRAHAGWLLKSPFGLVWHLQRNIFIGWFIGVIAMATTIGMLVPEMSSVYDNNLNMKQMITVMGGSGTLIPAFLSAMLMITSLMVAAYAVQSIGRLRAEESSGRLENLLASPVSRISWMLSHVMAVIVGSVVMLATAGLVLALFVNHSSADYTASLASYTAAGLSYLPVVLVFTGVYALLFGLLPRIAGVATWLYFAFVAFMSWLGSLLKLDETVERFNLLHHIPAAPASSINWGALFILVTLGAIMIAVGLLFWRRRDLTQS